MRPVRSLIASLAMVLFAPIACHAGGQTTAAQTETTPIAESNNSTAPSEPQGVVTYCDRYAASEFDGESLVIGLPINRVDPKAAIPTCREAVAKHPDSARLTYMLGRAYVANKEFTKAREAFSKAADSNFALAQLDLGFLYFNGLGVPQDYAEAAKWTRLAADQGLAPAQASLGAMYLDGKGVEQNRAKAAGLLKSAAARGFAPAEYTLAGLYASGEGIKQDLTEALRLYGRSANQGYAPAQVNFPWAHENGPNVEWNYGEEGSPSTGQNDQSVRSNSDDPGPSGPAAAVQAGSSDAVGHSANASQAATPPSVPSTMVGPGSDAHGLTAPLPAPDASMQPSLRILPFAGEDNAPLNIVVKRLDHRNSSGVATTAIEVSPLSSTFSMSGFSVNKGECHVYIQDPTTFSLKRAPDRADRKTEDYANVDENNKSLQAALRRISLPRSPFDQPVLAAFGQYLRFYIDPSVCDIRDIAVIVDDHEWKWSPR